MTIIEKLKDNPLVAIIILCSLVIPMTVGVTTWFYERQMDNVKSQYKAEIASLKGQLDLSGAQVRLFETQVRVLKDRIEELKDKINELSAESP